MVQRKSKSVKRARPECRCAGPAYHPDVPCPVHPKMGGAAPLLLTVAAVVPPPPGRVLADDLATALVEAHKMCLGMLHVPCEATAARTPHHPLENKIAASIVAAYYEGQKTPRGAPPRKKKRRPHCAQRGGPCPGDKTCCVYR